MTSLRLWINLVERLNEAWGRGAGPAWSPYVAPERRVYHGTSEARREAIQASGAMTAGRECMALMEGRDAPLYHATTYDRAISIIKQDRIAANAKRPQMIGGKPVIGVSLTRSWNLATVWGRVVFELDQAALAARYKLVPFSMDGTHKPNKPTRVLHYDPDDFEPMRRTHGERNTRMEAEEFCIGSITPLRSYLVKVYLLVNPAEDDQQAQAVRETCERLGLPLVVYEDPDPNNTLLRRGRRDFSIDTQR